MASFYCWLMPGFLGLRKDFNISGISTSGFEGQEFSELGGFCRVIIS